MARDAAGGVGGGEENVGLCPWDSNTAGTTSPCRPAAAAARLSAARAFIERFPAATEILIAAAARDAADDLARRITLMRGATFGLHRASFVQLVVRLAMVDMALRGFGHSAARADTIPDREAPARLEDLDIRPNRRMAPRLPAS